MYISPSHCPNPACINHSGIDRQGYFRVGYYKPKKATHPIPRFQCKSCGKRFSTSTFRDTYCDKLTINKDLFKLLVSGVSLRRCSELLEVDYRTIAKHFNDLAVICKRKHFEHLATIKTSYVQLDELETFLHARAKPLSVPMVVRVKTGEILGFAVARMPAKGKLAQIGQNRYGWTMNERGKMFQLMLVSIRHCFKQDITIKTDGAKSYPGWIAGTLPHPQWNVTLEQITSPKNAPKSVPKAYDKLFAINNTFAKLRHDVNRLGRKTWSTTKTIKGLENHLWLYVAWVNGYAIG